MSYGKINQQIVNGIAYGGANCVSVCAKWCSVGEILRGGERVGDSVRDGGVGDVVTDMQAFDGTGFSGSASPILMTSGGAVVLMAHGVAHVVGGDQSQLHADMVKLSSGKLATRQAGAIATYI